MSRSLARLACVLAALTLAAPGAARAQVQSWLYDHNGSTMRVEQQGARLRILYQAPRAGLGVTAGTLLFEGTLDTPRYASGMARIFSRRCGVIDYYVYGDFAPGQSFTLSGAAPVRDNSCRIVDNSYTNANANLRFTALRAAPTPAPQPVARTLCVRAPSGATLRTGPGPRFGALATLPGGTCNGEAQTQVTQGWIGVTFGAQIGWVAADSVGP